MKRPHYFKNKTSFSKIELFKNINTGSSHFSLQKCSCYEQVWESKFAIQCGNIYLSLKRDRHREYFFNPVLKCDQLIEHLLDHSFFWKMTLDVQLHLILTKWNEKNNFFLYCSQVKGVVLSIYNYCKTLNFIIERYTF